MNIDIKDIITLNNDQKYIVASKTNYQSKVYYLLVNEKDSSDVKFCYKKGTNNALIESTDTNINQAIYPLFANTSYESIKNIDLSNIN